MIGEARKFRPDPGVEDSDDDVIGVSGGWPEAGGVSKAEEVGGVGGVRVPDLVRFDGEDGGVAAEVGGLGGCETGGEAGGGSGVSVEEGGGGGGGGREGLED